MTVSMERFRFGEWWLAIDKLLDLRVAAASFLVLAIFTRFTWKSVAVRFQKGIPEPIALPVIGHLHLFGKLPHQILLKLAGRYGPLMLLRLGTTRIIVASDAAMAKEFMKTQDAIWASRPPSLFGELFFYNYGDVIMQPLNDLWRKLRKIYFSEFLSTTNVEKQKDHRHEWIMSLVNSLLASQRGNKSVDIYSAVAYMNSYQMTRLIFGKRISSEYTSRALTGGKKTLAELVHDLTSVDFLSLGECFPWLKWLDVGGVEAKVKRIHADFDSYLTELLKERHRQLLDGEEVDDDSRDFSRALLSLVNKEDGSGLTFTNIKGAIAIQQTNGYLSLQDIYQSLPFFPFCFSWLVYERRLKSVAESLIKDPSVPVENSEHRLTVIRQDMYAAGIETTSAVVTFTITEVLRHPEVKRKLVKELDDVVGQERLLDESDLVNLNFLKMVLKESLRLHPPAPLMVSHCSTAPTVVAGHHIPAGTQVLINVYAIQRDPENLEDPLAFKPERFSDTSIDPRGQHFELLPFGSGRRQCPGMNMGMITSELIVAQLFHTLDISLPPGMEPADVDMTEATGIATALATPLRVVVAPRLPEKVYSM